MSLSLANTAQIEFDAMVKAIYQSSGFLLRGTTRVRSAVTGESVRFRKVGQAMANPVGWQNTVAIQDPGFLSVETTMVKYCVGCACDRIQDLTVNFSGKEELAKVVARAIGRRTDQIVINALAAGDPTLGFPVANVIAAGGTNMSYAKLRHLQEFFEDKAIPLEDRYILLSGNNMRALLASDQIISNEYTRNMAVENGTLRNRNLMGMNIMQIPSMNEGGIPLAGNTRSCYAWHRDALGMAVGQEMRTEINYLPRETSWFINGIFFGSCVTIDTEGVYQIDCDESVNP